jgi:hypothetical protein
MAQFVVLLCLLGLYTRALAVEIPVLQAVFDKWSLPGAHDNIHTELRPRLSDAAKLYISDQAEFRASTLRWQEVNPPSFGASVEVSSEQDIRETVRHGKPFSSAR